MKMYTLMPTWLVWVLALPTALFCVLLSIGMIIACVKTRAEEDEELNNEDFSATSKEGDPE